VAGQNINPPPIIFYFERQAVRYIKDYWLSFLVAFALGFALVFCYLQHGKIDSLEFGIRVRDYQAKGIVDENYRVWTELAAANIRIVALEQRLQKCEKLNAVWRDYEENGRHETIRDIPGPPRNVLPKSCVGSCR
jgi:hypothetical protein